MLKNALVMGIFLAVCVAYLDRTEMPGDKQPTLAMSNDLNYSFKGQAQPYGIVTLFADTRGHFFADSSINGTHVNFLVDTGASLISLTELDAQRVGIDLHSLDYKYRSNTANGVVPVAVVQLDEVLIGGISVYNVEAAIHKGAGLDQSLLGMSLLRKLSSFQVDGTRLVMRQ